MTIKTSLFRILIGAGLSFLVSAAFAQNYDLPIRVVAVADVLQLSYGEYSIREFLDVYNDDFNQTLVITSLTANTYRGHRKHTTNENWQDGWAEIEVPPGKVKRIAERKRIVGGKPKRNWYIRWLRFTLDTNRGTFNSNFISSPFKIPGKLNYSFDQPQIDTLSEPGALTPFQKEEAQIGK